MSDEVWLPCKWLRGRENGGCSLVQSGRRTKFPDRRCTSDGFYRELYGAMKGVITWRPLQTRESVHHGGVFNFDFSTDGSLLVAACEAQSILMFDPLNEKLIKVKNKAHHDCVNCVRFLDSRTFATCSDDTTVRLWDARNLKHCIYTLHGHSNWVKNIEYSHRQGLLVTSGFDGSVYTWDINRYSDDGDKSFNRTLVFHTRGLMRTRLTQDSKKLAIATSTGYLMVIHNLDLTTLADDLQGFDPSMYRLMQMRCSPIRQACEYNHVFERKRNTVELISDFPEDNDANMISSLQVHPQGWCILTRNISSDDQSEWTCVHDIQLGCNAIKNSGESHGRNENINQNSNSKDSLPSRSFSAISRRLQVDINDVYDLESEQRSGDAVTVPRTEVTDVQSLEELEETQEERFYSISYRNNETTNTSNDAEVHEFLQEEPETNRSNPIPRDEFTLANEDIHIINVNDLIERGHPSSQLTESDSGPLLIRTSRKNSILRPDDIIHLNKRRLLYYIEEPNVGRGYIKELCFSADGRLICSPFGFGVRLLTFDPLCHELCDSVPDKSPVKLYELTSNMSHSDVVVTTKFSPTHPLFVSGCLDGKISFHRPFF